MTFDVLIRGGLVVDGSGGPATRADVAIRDDAIEAVGDLTGALAAEAVDATSLVVAPGFIDAHAHADLAMFDGSVPAALAQGVTTEILGQDGLSYAPLSRTRLIEQRDYLRALNGAPDVGWDWSSLEDYMDRLAPRLVQNCAFLLPYGALRIEVHGWRATSLSRPELRALLDLLVEGISHGAVGVAVGLDYFPQSGATRGELIEVARTIAASNAVFVAHTRNLRLGVGAAVDEFLGICDAAGARAHISHIRDDRALPVIDRALQRGQSVTFDVYPYVVGSTMLTIYLPDAAMEGGPAETLRRLDDPDFRDGIAEELHRNLGDRLDELILCNLGAPAHEEFVGRSLRETVDEIGGDAAAALLRLLVDNDLAVGFIGHRVADESLDACITHPAAVACSDGILIGQRPHPRAFGAFARFVARYVFDRRLLSLEDCIRRMTDATAEIVRLERRGRVCSGNVADLVVFDPSSVRDQATFEDPRILARGFVSVLIGGKTVWSDHGHTGMTTGRVLRPGGAALAA